MIEQTQSEKWRILKMIAPQACEHCHKNRTRRMCYLLGRADGKQLIVGRNCLKLFLTPRVVPARTPNTSESDSAHTQDMIANPDATLAHAIDYLCRSTEWPNTSFIETVKMIQKIREAL